MHTTISRPRPRRPIRRPRPWLIVAAAALIVGVSYLATSIARPPEETAVPPAPVEVSLPADAPGPADGSLARIDTAIATWSGNLARDDGDFIAAVQLGELYLARTRLTSDPADVARALAAADAALVAAPDLPAARLLRAHAHLANHDFAAAVTDAEAVLAGQPGAPLALAALGDATLELGEYDAARRAYDALADAAAGPAVQARLARLAAATGDLAGARRLADAALAAANRGSGYGIRDAGLVPHAIRGAGVPGG